MFVMFALPPVWAQNIAMSLSVCLTTHIFQRPHSQTSQNFLYMLIVAMARSSSDDFHFCGWRHVCP